MKYKHTILFFIASLFFVLSCQANSLIAVETPKQWNLVYKQLGKMHFYSYSVDDGEKALLMFSTPPYETDSQSIQQHVADEISFYAKQYKNMAKTDPEITKLDQQTIDGIEFSGKSVVVHHKDNFVQTSFAITNNAIIFSGQFTGSLEKWKTAVDLLELIKLNVD